MTLTEQSPKKIYLWSTEVKAVYKWTVKVRPEWWEPWTNCVSWYKLKDDLKDSITNTYMTTYSWATLTTFNWVKCLDLTASGSYTSNSTNNCSTWADDRTHMWWIYWTWIGNRAFWGYWTNGYGNEDIVYTNQGDPLWVWWRWIQWSQYGKAISTWEQVYWRWVCVAVTIESRVATIYQDAVSKNSVTLDGHNNDYKLNTVSWTALNFWKAGDGTVVAWKYIWEFVSFSRCLTAQEILDYYNWTKKTYWIS